MGSLEWITYGKPLQRRMSSIKIEKENESVYKAAQASLLAPAKFRTGLGNWIKLWTSDSRHFLSLTLPSGNNAYNQHPFTKASSIEGTVLGCELPWERRPSCGVENKYSWSIMGAVSSCLKELWEGPQWLVAHVFCAMVILKDGLVLRCDSSESNESLSLSLRFPWSWFSSRYLLRQQSPLSRSSMSRRARKFQYCVCRCVEIAPPDQF